MASLHVVLFPFMSKGHTIPIIDFAHLLLRRGAAVTFFTTPANHSFIAESLAGTPTSIVDLPFPQNIEGVPPGVESTDKLPSMTLFVALAIATKSMQPHFENALQKLVTPPTCIVSDGFLSWTLDSANKFRVPRLVYYGFGGFAFTVSRLVMENRVLEESGVGINELIPVPDFPWIKLSKNDFEQPFLDQESRGPHDEFLLEVVVAASKSYGMIANTFYELESTFIDYSNYRKFEPKSWCVGPLCLAEPPRAVQHQNPKSWVLWLDEKKKEGKPVLYVAFGSQAELSPEQTNEIKLGLEKSNVNFLWVVRGKDSDKSDEFEQRVENRGLVVREWVNQRQVLEHESIQGFLSHCGWNSVLESISAKVPILAWPMLAEQPLNARFVADVARIGLRVHETARAFVKSDVLEEKVKELMEGEVGKEARKNVRELGEAAAKAVEEGGSSWKTLNELITQLQACSKKTSTV